MAVAPGTGNHKGCPYDVVWPELLSSPGGRRERATARGMPLRRVPAGAVFSWLAPVNVQLRKE